MKCGIDQRNIDAINNIFKNISQIERVILFGSRAKGNYKEGSDVDFALVGKDLDLSIVSRIDYLLDELNLPYSFDIVLLDRIDNSDLVEHIQRAGKIFYEKRQ
jgi:predicted nucleotidyltransferase